MINQRLQNAEEVFNFLRGEYGGRLIEDEDVGVTVQDLDDFNPLLNANGQVFDVGIGIDVKAVFSGDFPDFGGNFFLIQKDAVTVKTGTSIKCW